MLERQIYPAFFSVLRFGNEKPGALRKNVPLFGSSYNECHLYGMRQLFLCFNDLAILNTRVQNLSWTHYRMLLCVPDEDARYWYLREASEEMWSSRTLSRNVGSQYYLRFCSKVNTSF